MRGRAGRSGPPWGSQGSPNDPKLQGGTSSSAGPPGARAGKGPAKPPPGSGRPGAAKRGPTADTGDPGPRAPVPRRGRSRSIQGPNRASERASRERAAGASAREGGAGPAGGRRLGLAPPRRSLPAQVVQDAARDLGPLGVHGEAPARERGIPAPRGLGLRLGPGGGWGGEAARAGRPAAPPLARAPANEASACCPPPPISVRAARGPRDPLPAADGEGGAARARLGPRAGKAPWSQLRFRIQPLFRDSPCLDGRRGLGGRKKVA